MADYNITYPKDSIVVVKVLNTLTGGRTIDVTGNLNEAIEAGSVVTDNAGTLGILSSGKAETAAASGDSVVQVYKGHNFVVGDSVKAATITSIDQSNAGYDVLTCSGTFGAAISLDEAIVNDGNLAIGVVMTTKVVKDDNTVDVGILTRGEVNEAVMTAPIDSNVKTACPLIEFVTD